MKQAVLDTPEANLELVKSTAAAEGIESPSVEPQVEVAGEQLDQEAIQEMRRYMMEPSVTKDKLGKRIQRWRDRRQEIRAKLDRKIDRSESGRGAREVARRLRQMEKKNGKKLQEVESPGV